MLIKPDDPLIDTEKEIIRFLIDHGGLNTGEARIFAALSREYDCTYRDIGKITGLSRSSISGGMLGLIKRG